MFLTFDGSRWRALPGGLARALSEEDALAGRLPRNALSKDVWVMEEETSTVQGALALLTPTLAIRRTAGDLPSRVADNFYWLGRYLERLEEAARLQRAIIARILRPSPTAREVAEMQILVASLTKVKMMDAEDASVLGAGMLAAAVMRAFRHDGGMRRVLAHVARQVEQLRDRLTGEMHAVLTRSLRILGENMRRLPAGRERAVAGKRVEPDHRDPGIRRDGRRSGGGEHGARRRPAVPGFRPADGTRAGDHRANWRRCWTSRARPPSRGGWKPGCGWRWSCGIRSSPTARATLRCCSRRRRWT